MTRAERPHAPIEPALLREIGLFGGMSQDTLELLARELPTQQVEVGHVVVREGDESRAMYVVTGGELEVVKRSKGGQDVRVALFGPGDWFGEMGILAVQPRSATVRAVAPTLLIRLTSEDVERLLYRRHLKDYSLFMMNIARELSRRLRVADGILADFVATVSTEYVHKS
ncbi:MAG: cyclic nucleotide-binding domain-containing protein [Myxococcota bacterium]